MKLQRAENKTTSLPASETPQGWFFHRLEDIVHPIQSGTSVSGEDRCPSHGELAVLKVSAVTSGKFNPNESKAVIGVESLRLKTHVLAGAILVNRANGSADLIGSAVYVRDSLRNIFLSDKLWQITPRQERACGRFIGFLLSSGWFRAKVLERSSGGTGMMNIGSGSYLGIRIPCPPLPEQRKIAEILGTWDEALEKLDALIQAKERRKKALMQQLLTGKRRLKESNGKIQFLRASELFTNRSERNVKRLPVLSVTQDQGVVLRSDLERRITHDENNTDTYKIVKAGDFIISLRSFQGGLEYSELSGAVSPAYHVIHPITEIDRSYYRHYFKSPDFVSRLATAVIGIRDGKQISFTDFGFVKLPNPSIEDQCRIGALLDTCDEELRLLRAERDALDQQKRGLMQRLLTGRVRVKL